ncbi:YcaO-like protein with predicted kinase domain [Ensifer sp. WSM1721]
MFGQMSGRDWPVDGIQRMGDETPKESIGSERRAVLGNAYSDRVCSPEETLARVRPFLAGFGVTRVARQTGLDHIGLPVWCAFTPNARSIVVAQGKGLTDADAKVSAIMEALERAVAGQPAVETVVDTARNLGASGRAADPLPGLTAAGREDVGPDEEITWVGGVDLVSGRDVFVPLEAVLLDRTRPSRFWMSSDGLASGNVVEEAMLHGILERVERDAHVLWQVSGPEARHRKCVAPEAFGDPVLGQLVERIKAAGLELRLFDITSDMDIPAFLALLAPSSVVTGGQVRFVEVTSGCGAHLFPVRAAIRAVTEAVQSRLTYVSGARDDVHPEAFSRPLPETTRRAFLAEPRRLALRTPSVGVGLGSLLRCTIDRVKEAGVRSVIAVRLSADRFPFSVVKVVIPDLESPEGNRARRFGLRALSRAISS